jgi:hypothetical protein
MSRAARDKQEGYLAERAGEQALFRFCQFGHFVFRFPRPVVGEFSVLGRLHIMNKNEQCGFFLFR